MNSGRVGRIRSNCVQVTNGKKLAQAGVFLTPASKIFPDKTVILNDIRSVV